MSCPHCLSTSTSKRKFRTSLGYRTFYFRDCDRRFNERSGTAFNDLQFPNDIVLMAVLWRLKHKLGFRDVAEFLLQQVLKSATKLYAYGSSGLHRLSAKIFGLNVVELPVVPGIWTQLT